MEHKPNAPTSRLRSRLRDESGISLIVVAGGMFAFIAATTLSIDLGLIMTARTQAQRAADAGALAGATALVYNSFDDKSPSGPAVTAAINTAQSNLVVDEAPSVVPDDVTFPLNPVTLENDLVEVKVHRTAARGNPISLFMAQVMGIDTANITATARATAAPAGAASCVLPLTIPDKWTEVQDPNWDPLDNFNIFADAGSKQNNGAPLPNPDVYIAPGNRGATGYNPHRDRGLRLVLKENNDNKLAPGMYNPWDIPGSVGGNDYEENIQECNPHIVNKGDRMIPENGNMQGPTTHGARELIEQDPDAQWVDACQCVKYSRFRQSPRIRIMPLYDPVAYANDQKTGKAKPDLIVVNYLGVFVEDVVGGEIIGRVTPIIGKLQAGVPMVGSFAQAIMLVK